MKELKWKPSIRAMFQKSKTKTNYVYNIERYAFEKALNRREKNAQKTK